MNWFVQEVLNIGLSLAENELTDGLQVAVEVHGADEGFEGVGERGGADPAAAGFFTLAHHEVITQANGDGVNLEALPGYEARAHFGKLAFGKSGEALKEMLRKDDLQNRVSKKFEALVVEVVPLGFMTQTRVSERFRQEKGVTELVLDPLFERIHQA